MDIYTPRREALEETIPVITLILDFQNLELQGNAFGPLSYQVFGPPESLVRELDPTYCD